MEGGKRVRETQRETDKTPAPVTHFLMWVVRYRWNIK